MELTTYRRGVPTKTCDTLDISHLYTGKVEHAITTWVEAFPKHLKAFAHYQIKAELHYPQQQMGKQRPETFAHSY